MPRLTRLVAPVVLAGAVLSGCSAPDISGAVALPAVADAAPAAAKTPGATITGSGYTFTAPAGFTAATTDGVDAGAVGPAAKGIQPTVTVRMSQPTGENATLKAAMAAESQALQAQGMTGVKTMKGTRLAKVPFTQLEATHPGLAVKVREVVMVRTPKSGTPTVTVLTFTVRQDASAKELKAVMAPVLKSWRWA